MALGQKKNVIVGAARIFVGDPWDGTGAVEDAVAGDGTGWAPKADTGSYAATLEADTPARFVSVGFTQDGLEVAYSPEYGEVEVDQMMDTPRMFKQSMNLSLNTTLAEATLTNLMVSWGQPTSTLNGLVLDVESGALGEAPVERGLIAVGNGPEGTGGYSERTYFTYRVVSVEASSHALRRNEATVFPVSFRALPLDSGRYGQVRDRVLA